MSKVARRVNLIEIPRHAKIKLNPIKLIEEAIDLLKTDVFFFFIYSLFIDYFIQLMFILLNNYNNM